MLARSWLLPALIAAPLAGQKADLSTSAEQEQALQFSIETRSSTETTRRVLVDGEEPEEGALGGRGFGGAAGGPTELKQRVVFDQGPAKANWRHYRTLEALEKRQGRDGEPVENQIQGALAGKKVRLTRNEDGATVLVEGDGEQKKELPAQLGRGIAHRVELGNLLAGKTLEVGETYDLGKKLRPALAGLVHPVTPENAGGPRGEGGRGGEGRGQGGGGEPPTGDQPRGEGGPGRGARGVGGRGAGSTIVDLLQNDKLDCLAKGKLVAVEQKDGRDLARIEITATISGKGDAATLGLRSAMGLGRGGRRGGGEENQASQGTSTADIRLEITGMALVDLGSRLVTSLELKGKLDQKTETSRTMDIGGEERQLDMATTTTGTFALNASCTPATQQG